MTSGYFLHRFLIIYYKVNIINHIKINYNHFISLFFRAVQLVECSALERENMHEVFEEAVRAALKKKQVTKRTCNFL